MNVKIDHTNYEAYLLDRIDGTISPADDQALSAFLILHPDLVPDDGELPNVQPPNVALGQGDKDALKRTFPPIGMPGDAPLDDLLIARIEGDLTQEQLNALSVYLTHHPEHRNAERVYAMTKLVPEAMAFVAKQSLVRSLPPKGLPDRFNVEDLLIARLEGDLDQQQERALVILLANDPALMRYWSLLQKTRIPQDPIFFSDKASLKKEVVVFPFAQRNSYKVLAVAASLLLLFGIGFWFLQNARSTEKQVAENVATESKGTSGVVPGTKVENDTALEYQQDSDTVRTNDTDRVTTTSIVVPNENAISTGPNSTLVSNGNGVPKNVTPNDTPIFDRASAQELIEQKPFENTIAFKHPAPQDIHLENVPIANDGQSLDTAMEQQDNYTIGGFLIATVRDHVLDDPSGNDAPLDRNDAVAAVDKSLKVIAGDQAGLNVERKNGQRTFDLRLGRNFSISAQR